MYRYIKRIIDCSSALLLLIVLSPLLLVLAVLVRVNLGSPIFFCQRRTGQYGKSFKIIKFRTMTSEKNDSGELLSDELRSTSLGRFLRSKSLDELPELLNIIRGDMAVIGPRPLPPIYDSFYTSRERKRFEVRSGLIPPDSVDDNVIIDWSKQLEYEANYAENISFKLDLKIFLSVFTIIFKRSRTNYGGYVRDPLHIERKKMNENE